MRQYPKQIAPMKKLLLWIIAACPMFAQNIVGHLARLVAATARQAAPHCLQKYREPTTRA
jgi:N-acetyl-anhydromuramyl-L-alanine amidase AmpD